MGPRDGGAKREFDQARAEKAVTDTPRLGA